MSNQGPHYPASLTSIQGHVTMKCGRKPGLMKHSCAILYLPSFSHLLMVGKDSEAPEGGTDPILKEPRSLSYYVAGHPSVIHAEL